MFDFGGDEPPSDENDAGNQAAQDTAGWIKETLSQPYPQLLELVEEETLSPDEALQAANQIDGLLGRYLTGTRYAAP